MFRTIRDLSRLASRSTFARRPLIRFRNIAFDDRQTAVGYPLTTESHAGPDNGFLKSGDASDRPTGMKSVTRIDARTAVQRGATLKTC